jgi:membrane-associated protein
MFLIIFLETGFIFTPFLPGDSLLFTAGALSAVGELNILVLICLLLLAAILGDGLNYVLGRFCGKTVKRKKLVREEYLIKTENFFKKYGGKTIILARFFPIIRTFAPFVAGGAKMNYLNFLLYNIIGAFAWVLSFTLLGYFFGNIPFIKENLSLVVLTIITASVLIFFIAPLRKRVFG